MITPKSRREFERNLNIFKESLAAGKTKLMRHSRVIKGLIEARKTPNGRINFHTIEETLRLNANMSFNLPLTKRNEQNIQNLQAEDDQKQEGL